MAVIPDLPEGAAGKYQRFLIPYPWLSCIARVTGLSSVTKMGANQVAKSIRRRFGACLAEQIVAGGRECRQDSAAGRAAGACSTAVCLPRWPRCRPRPPRPCPCLLCCTACAPLLPATSESRSVKRHPPIRSISLTVHAKPWTTALPCVVQRRASGMDCSCQQYDEALLAASQRSCRTATWAL